MLLKDFDPDCIAVAFDEGRETVRTAQYADYKKDRRPMPDDLVVQIPFVYEVLEGFGIPVIRSAEWEADDFIGSLACTARDRGYDVVIATSDKDFFQLVGDGIRLYHTGRETLYDANSVVEVFGLPPEKVVDVMAIWGDAIDNIPGVPGIGEKGAKTLIREFGSLEGVYENLDQIKRASQKKSLEDNRDKAFLSRELARIKCDLDVAVDFDALKRSEPDLRELLQSDRVFIAYDAKAQERRLRAGGYPVPKRWADVMLMSYDINPGLPSHALGNISRDRLKRDILVRKEIQKTAPLFELDHEVGSSRLAPYQDYLGDKSDVTIALHEVLEPELRRDAALVDIYGRIEVPLFPVLARMEERGIRVDADLLRQMSSTMGAQLADLEKSIYKEAGTEFNINSPQQLGHVLFEKLNYPVVKKTKTKGYSTSGDVLEELATHGFAVPQLILRHRELSKLKGTYIDALPQLVAKDGRVHTTFNQAVAATGRLSSSDPNLQNIPIRTQTGREIRKAFVADEGWVLLSADYSQVELRILAHISQDEALIETFRSGADIHRATASGMFNIAPEELSAEQRRAAKTINFGVLYGMSAFRLSNELNISTGEAKAWIDA